MLANKSVTQMLTAKARRGYKPMRLANVRCLMQRGESLFLAQIPQHFTVQEMLTNLAVKRHGFGFANRYRR